MPARKSTNRKPPKESPAAARQADAEQQLDSFLAKYDPEVAAFARRALAKMRKLVPGAVEMVYDNYDWLVVGFSPTERPSKSSNARTRSRPAWAGPGLRNDSQNTPNRECGQWDPIYRMCQQDTGARAQPHHRARAGKGFCSRE